MSLLVVIPFCDSDCKLAIDLLHWMGQLGGCVENSCLLVAASNVLDADCEAAVNKARPVFKDVAIINLKELKDESHPVGPNWMFQNTALHVYRMKDRPAFLWIEPDCTPMRTGWLKEIEQEYAATSKIGRKILAHVTELKDTRFPLKVPSGVAVYPGDAWEIYKTLVRDKSVAWDVRFANQVMPTTYHSRTIWNRLNRVMLPIYVKKKVADASPNTITLDEIKGFALTHPCKDGSLISLLRGDDEPSIPQLLMAWKTSKEATVAQFPAIQVAAAKRRYVHCVERHVSRDDEEVRRVANAFNSWVEIYKQGRMVPMHVWDYPRHSGAIGDDRHLPHIKDILIEGMTIARPDDVIVLTNDDTILHPKICEIMDTMGSLPAFGSMRLNFPSQETPDLTWSPEALTRRGQRDLGRDLMAFRKSWLAENWLNIPDFYLGELEWDLVFATMIRKSAGVFTDRSNIKGPCRKSELPYGYVLHETHQRRWTMDAFKKAPAKLHNRKLATVWYGANGFPGMIPT